MAQIEHYAQLLRNGTTVRITTGFRTFYLAPPDVDDPDVGPLAGMTATEAVALSRGIGAWLRAHYELWPRWHHKIRKLDPGGLTVPERTKVENDLAEALAILAEVRRYAVNALKADEDPDVVDIGYELVDILDGK